MNPILSEDVKKEWQPLIESEECAPIQSRDVRNSTIRLLENTKKALSEETSTANVAGFDPVLISMVRRTMPSLIAHDIIGVQPMSMPTGLIFAMKAHYTGDATTGAEAFGTTAPNAALSGPATTADGETLGRDQTGNAAATYTQNEVISQLNPWAEMSFAIEKVSVAAQTRALKAKYTIELAQDLKAVHGMDAEAELANILSGEVVAEINREIVALVNSQAVAGAQNATVPGTYAMATDADGRWEVEKGKNLYLQIVRESALIAQQSRRGLGNFIICSPAVLALLEAATKLDVAAIAGGLNNDFIGATFAGILGGRFRVYVDPYATTDFVTVGYKGTNVYDSGIFYCPYVPLQLMKATGEEDFQPRLGMKTRYAMAINPFVGSNVAAGTGANVYYRTFVVTGV